MNQARVEVSLGRLAQCVFQGEVLVRGVGDITRETVELVIEGPSLPPPVASGVLPKVQAVITEQRCNIEFKPID